MTGSIGLIAAMPSESKAFLRLVTGVKHTRFEKLPIDTFFVAKQSCVLITSGMGVKRAARAAQILVEKFTPQLLISFGIAGAVEEDLDIGDVVLSAASCQLEQAKTGPLTLLASWPEPAQNAARQMLANHGKRLLTGTAVTTSGSQVAEGRLANITHPVLEMETGGIALVIAQKGIPLLSLRAISDGPRQPIPFDLGEVMDEDSNLRMIRLLRVLLQKPQILIQAGWMWRNSQLAAASAALALWAALQHLDLPTP
jgi:adenosylhomocysteine nucleosidase